MRQVLIFFSLLVVLTALVCQAATAAEIELTDGSVIRAEIVSASAGMYTLKSDSLGTLKVEQSKIKNISLGDHPVTDAKNSSYAPVLNEQITAMRNSMTSDPATMDKIFSLEGDPDFQTVLNDATIMNSVNSGDVSALMSNPKFLNLINKPAVQDIIKGNTK